MDYSADIAKAKTDGRTSCIPEITGPLFNTAEVSRIFGVRPATLRRWLRTGLIPARKNPANGRFFFTAPDIERMLSSMDPVEGSGESHTRACVTYKDKEEPAFPSAIAGKTYAFRSREPDFMVSGWMVGILSLSANSLLAYAAILAATRDGVGTVLTNQDLAQALSVTEQTSRNVLAYLEQKGVIAIERAGSSTHGPMLIKPRARSRAEALSLIASMHN